MAAKFARERMVQIYKDANFKPSTVLRIKSLFVCFLFCFSFRREDNFDTAAV